MSKDHIAEKIGWLDEVFTNPDNPKLFHADKTQSAIEKEISSRWVQENRLQLLNDLAKSYGEEEVFDVLDKILYSNCSDGWKQKGKEQDNSLQNFIKILWEPLKDEGVDFSMEKKGNQTKFCVRTCPMSDLAKELGAEKWFYHLLCLTDEPTVTGFNKGITFSRTKTLMQGDKECDHCYTEI